MPEGEGVRQGERGKEPLRDTVRIAMHGVRRTEGLTFFRGINRLPNDFSLAPLIDFLFTSAFHSRRQVG